MAVFYINIAHDNGKLGELSPYRDFNLSNFDRSVELLVCFADKLINNLILKEKYGDGQREQEDATGQ